MRSAWIIEKQTIEIREQRYVPPESEEVVVRVRACGICGTDLHFYHDFPAGSPTPLGHEVAGTVHEIGESVSDLQPGQEVIVQNNISCGSCTPCLMGRPAHCRNIQTYMDDRAAAAEYIRVHRKFVLPFSGLSFEEAALAEPLTVAFDLLRRAQVEPFQQVCISGPGIIGLFCTKLAVEAGARVVVLGRAFEKARGGCREQTARNMGAAAVVDTKRQGWIEKTHSLAPEGFDKIIVTSPPRSIPPLFELAAFGADVIFNGISFREADITFDANAFHFKKLALIASHAIPNWGFPLACDLLAEKRLDHESLITHRFPFEQIEEALKVAGSQDQGVIKVMITLQP
jgi:L-iditol 2-dehydrogenase